MVTIDQLGWIKTLVDEYPDPGRGAEDLPPCQTSYGLIAWVPSGSDGSGNGSRSFSTIAAFWAGESTLMPTTWAPVHLRLKRHR